MRGYIKIIEVKSPIHGDSRGWRLKFTTRLAARPDGTKRPDYTASALEDMKDRNSFDKYVERAKGLVDSLSVVLVSGFTTIQIEEWSK